MSVVAANFPEHGFPLPPEPELTPADVVARAEAFASELVERQAETENRTFYATDTHEAFSKAGLYRILVPRRYGGYEFGVDTFVKVAIALTRGCPSTGWMYTLGAAHALAVATVFPESAQDELFAGGDFLAPATIMPSGTAERVDGGWKVNGTWGYCSGAPYATHFVGHALAPGASGQLEPMLFIAPREQWRRLDDWGQQLGLRGSGSHSITVEDAIIPDHYTLPGHMSQYSVADGTPGLRLHGNVEYSGGPLSFMNLESAVLAVGIAKAALDAFEDLMRTRTTLFPPVVTRFEDPDYQYWYGEATGMIATAEVGILGAVRLWQEACAAGPAAFTRELEMRLAGISRQVEQLCWRAVEGHLLPTAGSSSVRRGERLERIWRDMSMLHTHAGSAVFLAAKAQRELSRAHFGLPDELAG
ncbi:acyl-CoA dehydrogenase [Actinophytocola xinjiangensis]|uniref:Acyl-CoA dehydrogenase n=1 Tax=Actinophytocola xinjiangensis TaxID=485602 RepID=A0A7Z0WTI5_9PSEU|nr:acyl-CoA dehydrogenase family protein [Actinophytocola xinjiangensis]OLF12964.1 acyl-CoA dehydrogenase [Actinophytocola xinjiangensis]